MKRHVAAATGLILVLVALASAASDTSGMRTVGIGDESCRTYVTARQAGARDTDFVAWLGGFLSALSWVATTQGEKDFLDAGTDMGGWLAWLDSYCRDHPVSSFGRASVRLTLELRRHASP